MKVRLGFVSNSSSSSFVLITTKENHARAFKNVHPYVQAVIKGLAFEDAKFAGINVVVHSGYSDMGGCSEYDNLSIEYDGEIPENLRYEDDDGEIRGIPQEAYDEYLKELCKNEDEVFQHSVDM